MTYERLTSLKSSANLQYMLEEENRLDQLAQATSSAFKTTNYWVWTREGFHIWIPVIVRYVLWLYTLFNNLIYYIITNLLLVITVCIKILWFARQKKGEFFVCLTPPPALLLFSLSYVPLCFHINISCYQLFFSIVLQFWRMWMVPC
jgi:hypothetical protein